MTVRMEGVLCGTGDGAARRRSKKNRFFERCNCLGIILFINAIGPLDNLSGLQMIGHQLLGERIV